VFGRLISRIRWFFIRIKNAFQYGWRGWKTYDFDSHNALADFTWKLTRLSLVIRKNKRHVGWEKDVKHIGIVVYLLNRVMADEYYFPDHDRLIKKYGELKFYPCNDGTDNSFMRHERETPENAEQIRKENKRAINKAQNRRQLDWDYSLTIIHKYFFHWWN